MNVYIHCTLNIYADIFTNKYFLEAVLQRILVVYLETRKNDNINHNTFFDPNTFCIQTQNTYKKENNFTAKCRI